MAWSSAEYIGTDRIEFSSKEPEGTTQMPPIDTGWAVAELTSTFNVDGITTMVSKLHIIIFLNQTSSIVCHDLGNGPSNSTISFNVERNISLTCNKNVTCPGEQVTCTCTTAHSNTLAWIGGKFFEDQIQFSSTNIVTTTKEEGSVSAVLIHNSAQNGVRVMKASLTLTFSASESHNLTCLNVGEDITARALINRCTTVTFPTEATATTTIINEGTDTTSSDTGPGKDNIIIIPTVTGGGALFITVIIIIILLLYLCCCPPFAWKIKLGLKDAGGDDDKTGNGVTNKDYVMKMQERLTKVESAIQEVREEDQRKREEMAKDLRADYQKEMKEMAEVFRADHLKEMETRLEELKVESQKELQRMVERIEEVRCEKQRELKEMEEKLRTERQSEIDKLNTQVAKLRDEVKKLEETCEQLREHDHMQQKEVEMLEQEVERLNTTRRRLESVQGNDSGMELRHRTDPKEMYSVMYFNNNFIFKDIKSIQFDMSSNMTKMLKARYEQLFETIKDGMFKRNSFVQNKMPPDLAKLIFNKLEAAGDPRLTHYNYLLKASC